MLMELAPKEALVRRDGREMVLPVEEVKISDSITIRLGENSYIVGFRKGTPGNYCGSR